MTTRNFGEVAMPRIIGNVALEEVNLMASRD